MGMLEPEFLIHLEKMLLPLVYGGHLEMIGIAFSQNRQLEEYDEEGCWFQTYNAEATDPRPIRV